MNFTTSRKIIIGNGKVGCITTPQVKISKGEKQYIIIINSHNLAAQGCHNSMPQLVRVTILFNTLILTMHREKNEKKIQATYV